MATDGDGDGNGHGDDDDGRDDDGNGDGNGDGDGDFLRSSSGVRPTVKRFRAVYDPLSTLTHSKIPRGVQSSVNTEPCHHLKRLALSHVTKDAGIDVRWLCERSTSNNKFSCSMVPGNAVSSLNERFTFSRR